jgi:hypothetical protein
MRLREREMPMDPDVERELAAIDAGLTGLAVPDDLEDLAALSRELRSERSAPDPEFGARLDERAAEGFPREAAGDAVAGSEKLRRLRDRLAATPPRRLIAPVGAAATLLVAVGVAVSVSDELGGSGGTPQVIQAEGQASSAQKAPPSGVPAQGAAGEAVPQATHSTAPARDQYTPPRLSEAHAPAFNTAEGRAVRGLSAGGRGALPAFVGPSQRKVAKNADLVLSAEPHDVRGVADGVVNVVDRYHGFVVRSHVTSGRPQPGPIPLEGGAGRPQPLPSGTFELRIPAVSLRAALGDLSDLAHVTSRTESVRDITSRFNSSEQRVADLEAQRDQLLQDLAEAFTIEEQESLKARLRIVEHQLANAKDQLAHVQQRIHLVPVTVEILAEKGVDNAGAGGGSWGIGDALHDAGRVLVVIGGVLLISAAVLGPIALLVALGWFGARAVLRLRRERALD